MRRTRWLALGILLAGCGGGADVAPAGGGAAGDPAAAEAEARLAQWVRTLAEPAPGGFRGDPDGVAWLKRKEAAATSLTSAGAPAVPPLLACARRPVEEAGAGSPFDPQRSARASGERQGRTWALAILGEIADPAAAVALRELVPPTLTDPEALALVLEGLGRRGDASDVARVKPLIGAAPHNTITLDGPGKVKAELDAVAQNAAIEAAARLGDPSGMPILIQNLAGGGWARRDAARRLLALTGHRFGFALDAEDPVLRAAIDEATKWWEAAKTGWTPAALPEAQTHDVYRRVTGGK